MDWPTLHVREYTRISKGGKGEGAVCMMKRACFKPDGATNPKLVYIVTLMRFLWTLVGLSSVL